MSNFYPIPDWEIVVENKSCKHCNESFPITDKDLEFYEKISPVFNGKKYSIPTPTLCPDCRQRRRLSVNNSRNLYTSTSKKTAKKMISMYSPDKEFKIYTQKEWWSDNWDPMTYGKEFNFSRGFFEQFEELFLRIPLMHTSQLKTENSEYSNFITEVKNSYLVVNATNSENCFYSNNLLNSNNIINCSYIEQTNIAYDSTLITESFNIINSFNCNNCKNIAFSVNCKNCSDCINCFDLEWKKYCINNIEYSKEEFNKKKIYIKYLKLQKV